MMTIRDALGTINFGCLDPRTPPDCDEGVNIDIGGLDEGYSSRQPSNTEPIQIGPGYPLVNNDQIFLWLGSFGDKNLWCIFFVANFLICWPFYSFNPPSGMFLLATATASASPTTILPFRKPLAIVQVTAEPLLPCVAIFVARKAKTKTVAQVIA